MMIKNAPAKRKQGLRHLILGAVILFALAVIFLPSFFDYVPEDVFIPKLVQAPVEPAQIVLTSKDFVNTNPDVTSHATGALAWSVKINQSEMNPAQIVAELMKAGYPAFINKTNDVLVGPETNQETLNHWLQDLQKKHFKTEIIIYEPGK